LHVSQLLAGPSWFWKTSSSFAFVGSGTVPMKARLYQTLTCPPVRHMETVIQPVEPSAPHLLTELPLA
jgi:hypothetical protein